MKERRMDSETERERKKKKKCNKIITKWETNRKKERKKDSQSLHNNEKKWFAE